MAVKYLLNEKGEKEAAVIPIKEWEAIMKQLNGEESEVVSIPEWQINEAKNRLENYKDGKVKELDYKEVISEIEREL